MKDEVLVIDCKLTHAIREYLNPWTTWLALYSAALTIAAAGLVVPMMPYLLSFAAGAMIYVVVEELIPEMSAGEHSDAGTVSFAGGFTAMMILDVALG